MDRKSFAEMHCSVAQCLEVVGEWWSLLIVRDAFLGVSALRPVQVAPWHLPQHPQSATRPVWSRPACWTKVPYSEHPPRFEYRLTDKGRDLWPVITTMRQWGDKYAAPNGPPLEVIHKDCGQISEAQLVCSACGEPIGPRDVEASPGPGAVEPLIRTG